MTKNLSEQHKIRKQRQEFFAASAIQLLDKEQQRNQEAIDRARDRLDTNFARYRTGVPKFAEDLTSWGTRYQLAEAALSDWWSKSNEARKVATDRFADLVVSDQQMQRDVAAIIDQFSYDLEANRNQMLGELREKVSIAACPCASTDLSSATLVKSFATELQPLLQKEAKNSVVVGSFAAGGGFIVQLAATKIVTTIINSMVTEVATEAAAGGSAMAAGALEGGAGGTLIEPGVGTAIGVVGGIIVGAVLDWGMDARFKQKVTDECNDMLIKMKKALWNEPTKGLASSFNQVVKCTRQGHETVLRKIIIGGEK